MENKTAEGLRERLFDTLDLFLKKEIGKDEVEGVCFLSEQIIKTAQVEIDIERTIQHSRNEEHRRKLEYKRAEKEGITMLSETVESLKSL